MPSPNTIISIQAVRSFAYGFGAVLMGAILAVDGFTPLAVGVVLTAMTVGMALASMAAGRWADRLGRLRVYRGLLLTMALAGAVFAFTDWLPWLLLAALTGTLATDPNDAGPLSSLEQVMLGRVAATARTRTYGRYNAAAYVAGAAGSLAAGAPGLLGRAHAGFGPGHRWFLVFTAAAAVALLLSRRIDRRVEVPAAAAPGRRMDTAVRRRILLISGLFAVDSVGGGFLAQGLVAYWLHRRFGLGVEVLGPIFFVGGLLQAFSALLAGPLVRRFGLVRTVALSQVPGNLLIAVVALAPTPLLAIPCLLVRYILSQADIPARQAFVMAAVPEADQMAAAAYTSTARYVLRPAAPLGAGALMQALMAGPFLAGAAVKLGYDLAFYLSFRRLDVDSVETAPFAPEVATA